MDSCSRKGWQTPFHRNDSQASVAELAYAQGLGPCVLRDVEVRLLSLAFDSPKRPAKLIIDD